MIYEILARYVGCMADFLEDGGRMSICHIFAVGVYLYDRTTSHLRVVGGVIFFRIVRMCCVGIVGRNKKTSGQSLVEALVVEPHAC